jgi:hypothetical protein
MNRVSIMDVSSLWVIGLKVFGSAASASTNLPPGIPGSPSKTRGCSGDGILAGEVSGLAPPFLPQPAKIAKMPAAPKQTNKRFVLIYNQGSSKAERTKMPQGI